MNLRELKELQKSWSDCKSPAIQKGATDNALKFCRKLKEKGIPIGPVCEIGPQYGYGLDALSTMADSVCFVELVPDFYRECLRKDYSQVGFAAEDIVSTWQLSKAGEVNFYLRDVAEHFYDAERAFEGIRKYLKDWIYLSSPIEPGQSRDEAHLSRFEAAADILKHLHGLTCVWEEYRCPTPNLVGRLEGIWRK